MFSINKLNYQGILEIRGSGKLMVALASLFN